jgi:ArsR family transcriptional regulator, lead/cadmium/zinc/bismuth-responsive transcriptional repressor
MASDHCDLLCLDLEVAEQLRLQRLPLADAEHAAGHARALVDPTRLMLAAALAEVEELCVCDLAWIELRSEYARPRDPVRRPGRGAPDTHDPAATRALSRA